MQQLSLILFARVCKHKRSEVVGCSLLLMLLSERSWHDKHSRNEMLEVAQFGSNAIRDQSLAYEYRDMYFSRAFFVISKLL